MLRTLASIALVVLLPLVAWAQDGRAFDRAAKTPGADGLKSIEYSGSSVHFALAQGPSPRQQWPRFADSPKRLALSIDRPLPLHGRIGGLHMAVGHGH